MVGPAGKILGPIHFKRKVKHLLFGAHARRRQVLFGWQSVDCRNCNNAMGGMY